MTVRTLGVVALGLFVGCVPARAGSTTTPIYITSSATANANASGPDASADAAPSQGQRIVVFPDKRIDRPTEIIGVLDFHSDATSEDKGFDELRARAAAMNADAVIGAEFEHGEGSGPSHLSGVVVRFLSD